MKEHACSNLLIIVIYAKDLSKCSTISSLLNITSKGTENIGLYFYINGKENFSSEIHNIFDRKFKNVWTFYNGKNVGIVGAYQKAINDVGNKFDWITFFDQDSMFDDKYINALITLSETKFNPNDKAVVPVIKAKNEMVISPTKNFLGRSISYISKFGYPTCINSMSTFRSDFLLDMSHSFPVDFFLDAFDNWLFYQMHIKGFSFKVLDNIVVSHDISLIEPEINDVFWARELMFVINTTRISLVNFPYCVIRLFWRLVRIFSRTKEWRIFNIMTLYKKYKLLKKDLSI